MRIISGYLSGRKLVPPRSLMARPTTDMAREGLFNILNNRIEFENCRVLDLFAGTGIIGFEFVSRGCRDVTAVERDHVHCAAIRQNIAHLEVTGLHLIEADVFKFLKRQASPFDIIFADPPYDHPRLGQVPGLIIGQGLLKPGGFLVLEHGPGNSFAQYPGFFEERHYGKVHFSFFRD
jgi:16S rRNA (guanine966-N2)-methyltransferase